MHRPQPLQNPIVQLFGSAMERWRVRVAGGWALSREAGWHRSLKEPLAGLGGSPPWAVRDVFILFLFLCQGCSGRARDAASGIAGPAGLLPPARGSLGP